MSVHPRWYRKQKRIELPQESKLPLSTQHHLFKKMITSKNTWHWHQQKYNEIEKKRETQKQQTCELSCKKSITLKRHRALKMTPSYKEKRNKVKARVWPVVFTETWKSQNSKATNNTAKCKPKHSNSKSRQKQKNKNVSKPPINVSKISILTKAAWFRPSKQNCKQVKAFSRPITHPFTLLGLSIRITAC